MTSNVHIREETNPPNPRGAPSSPLGERTEGRDLYAPQHPQGDKKYLFYIFNCDYTLVQRWIAIQQMQVGIAAFNQILVAVKAVRGYGLTDPRRDIIYLSRGITDPDKSITCPSYVKRVLYLKYYSLSI